MTKSSDLAVALATRLATIQTAAGYALDVKKVFFPLAASDFQQSASDLAEHEMPAIILYQGPAQVEPNYQQLDMRAVFHLELVRPWVPDADMWEMVGAIGKALWGGASDADANNGFRFHPSVVEPRMVEVVPDFGMLQGHRVWVVVVLVHYRVRYTDI